MPYTDPATVTSPRNRVRDLEVLFDKGPDEGSWSIARMKFDNEEAVGIRWNGEVAEPGAGTPTSHSHPTWFIIPSEIADSVVETARNLSTNEHHSLVDGYRAMAADTEREAEAEEWSEALLADLP